MNSAEGGGVDQTLIQEIKKLEEAARQFQLESKYVEAIGILEELLKIKKMNFGTNSKQFTRTCKQLCEICNILAVYYLKKEDVNSALDLLKKSEELCENNELGQAMTFNNMACYYRRIGKMRTALNFLQKALSIESRLQRPEIQADTHLNICAVLSQLNKHELALNHAMSAVILLQEIMLRKRLDPASNSDEEEEYQTTALGDANQKDRTAVLAIAYHNMGVEQEFLRSYPAAILSYKKAVNFAEKHLGFEDGITQNLRNVYENAKNELDVAVFKKSKKAGATAGGKGVQASKYYQGTKPKKGASSKQPAEMYDNMMTPRNEMERVDEAEEEMHGLDDKLEEQKEQTLD
ncbi:tpr domain containing protein [Stylonychia lemnae]|uniref:Tpr domain containing protein n=1 Tax=Stylonychia lemnae TaxID=5949 RepID=A0A078ARG4_STYLE|nr:tpr domain containing protein [Stylonychia lemnae]|eukprot:CDW83438.1 tpr domain containing protein [Stylonychia lemnae]